MRKFKRSQQHVASAQIAYWGHILSKELHVCTHKLFLHQEDAQEVCSLQLATNYILKYALPAMSK